MINELQHGRTHRTCGWIQLWTNKQTCVYHHVEYGFPKPAILKVEAWFMLYWLNVKWMIHCGSSIVDYRKKNKC